MQTVQNAVLLISRIKKRSTGIIDLGRSSLTVPLQLAAIPIFLRYQSSNVESIDRK